MKGAAASGHPLTTGAACEILEKGGNAFDAAVAAGFAASVAEPNLTSLGGGGFLLAYRAGPDTGTLYDFFVNAPGKGAPESGTKEFVPIELKFRHTVQVFHAGMASLAVPGMLRGLVHCFRELCTLDIEDIVAPALRYLEEGVEVTELQRYIIEILRPILTMTDYGKEIFGREDTRLFNPLLREFLGKKSPDAWLDALYGSGAGEFERQAAKAGGLVTARDLGDYEVIERAPLGCAYRGHEILTNPPPSFGGTLLCKALSMLGERAGGDRLEKMGEGQSRVLLGGVMKSINELRNAAAGTTHISVVDEEGNAASMTTSNGSNSGCFFGETGIMLNNMMGEDDLHPGGFHSMTPGERVRSMMSPTIIRRGGRIFAVLGSGGSKRIKTAMLQVIHNLIDRGMGPMDAVEAPRMHLDDEDMLQVEPGFSLGVLRSLHREFDLNVWDGKDLYFGGAHVVTGDLKGWGDSRRGGAFMRVE
jgi:gamma-glutamyltranspeptidase/glutathione hydrolase